MRDDDPRVIRTRQLLQETFLTLLAQKPFQSLSVSDLTKQAGVNRATFYLHYLDKFDLLAKTTHDVFIAALNQQLPRWEDFGIEDIQHLTRATCEFLEKFLRGCAPANKLYEPMIEAEMQHVLYDYIYCWLSGAMAYPQSTLPIETGAMVVSTAVLHMSLKWSRGETHYSKEEVVKQVYDIVTGGVLQLVPEK